MPTSATELGAAPSPRGLSRLRRNKDQANASSTSLASNQSSGENESGDGAGMRGSMDGLVDKVKSRARRSVDGRRGSDESTSGNRLSTFFDRKRKGSKPKNSTSPIRNRTFSVQSGDSGELALPGNQSDVSLANGSGNSSLLTDDYSENETKPTRPTISPHQSHLGYLTLSSPQLNAQAGPEPSQLDSAIQESTSAPASHVSRVPSIVEPAATDSLPFNGIPDRAPSPGSKLRSAFALNRKKSAGDLDSIKSGVGGGSGGLGGLFRPRSRRNSVDVQESSAIENTTESGQEPVKETVAPATAPQIQTGEERPQTPKERQRGRVNTNPVPSTPPSSRPETPTTFVTPPTPTDPSTRFPRAPISAAKQSPTRPLSSVESIKHRRAQSANLPSKLSNATAAPLTPFPEETKTPGGTLTQPIGATGFFTSVFSAAQKAADQLSSSINTSTASNQKKAAPETAPSSDTAIAGTESKSEVETKQTLDTLGSGNLSLSHLGIAESNDISPMNSTTDLSGQQDGTGNNSQANKAEEEAAARAVSVAYEKPVASTISQAMGARPASIVSQDRPLAGDQSPPRSTADADTIIKRSGSVRSRLSGRRRRHRGSSATTATANTIGTALRDSVTGLANIQSNTPGHRLTGFAVASSKRNKDFHQLFRSVPEDDYLIEDYSAALQKDILLHGRLYVSEGHICFSSNIFGWVTNLVISFDEVVSVEKKNTAVVFPNAIVISTLNARNTFASFVTRESTYELLIGIWKISHPNLKSTLNGVTVDKNNIAASDKTEKAESIGSEDDSDDGSDDEVYDEDDDDDDIGSFTEADAGRSIAGSDYGDNTLSRKTSAQPVAALANGAVPKGLEASDAAVTGAAVASDFPGVPTHAPTECSDTAEHYDRPLTDTIIPAPLGKIYSLMFGPGSSVFMKKWLVDDQKSRELDYADDKFGLDNDHKSFTFSYIKPLSGAVGPKQTKCITTNTLESFDLEKAITVNCSTQTPDVPSGNVFTTKTKYCLMWGPNNSTRMIANCTIEWTGKSWLKGPIESGAQSGQTAYITAILASLKAAVVTKPPVRGAPTSGGKKSKRRGGKREVYDAEVANDQRDAEKTAEAKSNWGLFEPVRPALEPLKPFVSSQVVIAVLITLLAYSWLFPGRGGGSGVGFSDRPERVAAYEELWRREESELWDWLEDRVGLDGVAIPNLGERQKALHSKDMAKKLRNEKMGEREVDEAIRVTEERLGVLKEAVAGKRKG